MTPAIPHIEGEEAVGIAWGNLSREKGLAGSAPLDGRFGVCLFTPVQLLDSSHSDTEFIQSVSITKATNDEGD